MSIAILLLMGFILGAVYGDTEQNAIRFLLVIVFAALGLIAVSVVNTLPFVLPYFQ
jgi:hypothetical protein